MSLHRQLVLLITAVLLVLLAGICYLSVQNSRNYIERQMHSHAQDTATSLSLSIAQPLAQQDYVLVQTMIDAIFDRGDFVEVTIRDPQSQVIISRNLTATGPYVPKWFVGWLKINPMPGVSEITSGWQRLGEVRILSDKEAAYRNLWLAAKQGFGLFLLVGLVSWVIILTIVRTVLTPLRRLEQQADAICRKEFTRQQALPRTREIRRVVQAINRMSRQLKSLFDEQVVQIEQVRNQAYVDTVTGLGNGRYFNAQLQARLDSDEEPFSGCLVRLQVKGLGEYNEIYGHDAGNLLLRRIGEVWRETMSPVEGACYARVTGTCFAALLPHQTREQAERLISDALFRAQALDALSMGGSNIQVFAGMSVCNLGSDPKLVEAQAIAALARAASAQDGQLEIYDEMAHGDVLAPNLPEVSDWQGFLQDIIDGQQVTLHYQPIFSCANNTVMHYEVFARIKVNGECLVAGHFIPLVERFGLQVQFDQMIVGQVIAYLRTVPRDELKPFAINLSSQSVRDEEFNGWLLETVKANGLLSTYLIFEVPEVTVRTAHGKLHRLASGLRELGAKLTIDHFGTTNSSFGYLSGLPLYSIKLDNSYIRDMDSNLDHQFFIQSLVRIAHSRSILLTAERVELQSQWQLLRQFNVDGAQGYYLGEPQERPALDTSPVS